MDEFAIGRQLRAARESAELSQEAVAEAMRQCGYKWRQSTVWTVESGERPLRLSEAFALRDHLGIDLTGDGDPHAASNAALVAQMRALIGTPAA